MKTATEQLVDRYPGCALLILAALPEHDAPPLSAREIAEKSRVCRGTARYVLWLAVKLGCARSTEIPAHHGGAMKVYTRTPATYHDDLDDCHSVYAQEPEDVL